MQNAKCNMQNRRTKQGQRVLAHYALQEGGKACVAGLMQNAELKKHKSPLITFTSPLFSTLNSKKKFSVFRFPFSASPYQPPSNPQ